MKTEHFNYFLPKELIAQFPAKKRGTSRLMVVNKGTKEIIHTNIGNICDFLRSNDALIFNNTKVIPARIFTTTPKKREILLIKNIKNSSWECFIKPKKGLENGCEFGFKDNSIKARITGYNTSGTFTIEFNKDIPLDEIGFAPLPPYIKRDYSSENHHDNDILRYQTIFAKHPGAIAAPTAGLHFTEELLRKINHKGVQIGQITLHVGIGTFRPVRTLCVEEHKMHSEDYCIPKETTEIIKKAKRVIAVGTTTVRTLETQTDGSGKTDLFIYPPYEFKVVDAILTNFHLPKSTLLMMISAFAGKELILKAYKEAINEKYSFFSYGDAMLIV